MRRVQGFKLYGLKGLSGATFIRSIVLIEAERRGAVSLFTLVKALEAEARLNGARQLLIVGHAVINRTLLRAGLPILERLGYQVRWINPETIEIVKALL